MLVNFLYQKGKFIEYGIATADGYLLPRTGMFEFPKHKFPAGQLGMFIRPSAGVPEGIGIVLVDDKLLYVSYGELEVV